MFACTTRALSPTPTPVVSDEEHYEDSNCYICVLILLVSWVSFTCFLCCCCCFGGGDGGSGGGGGGGGDGRASRTGAHCPITPAAFPAPTQPGAARPPKWYASPGGHHVHDMFGAGFAAGDPPSPNGGGDIPAP